MPITITCGWCSHSTPIRAGAPDATKPEESPLSIQVNNYRMAIVFECPDCTVKTELPRRTAGADERLPDR